MDDNNMTQLARMVNGLLGTYVYVERPDSYGIEYFKNIDSTYTYKRIIEEVGGPNGLFGSGIMTPYWEIEFGQYVAVYANISNENSKIFKIILCDSKNEIEKYLGK